MRVAFVCRRFGCESKCCATEGFWWWCGVDSISSPNAAVLWGWGHQFFTPWTWQSHQKLPNAVSSLQNQFSPLISMNSEKLPAEAERDSLSRADQCKLHIAESITSILRKSIKQQVNQIIIHNWEIYGRTEYWLRHDCSIFLLIFFFMCMNYLWEEDGEHKAPEQMREKQNS